MSQDGGKIVSLTHRPLLPPGNTPGTHFCWRLSRPQDHSAIGKMSPSGIVPATFRFVAQPLYHCATAVPIYIYIYIYIYIQYIYIYIYIQYILPAITLRQSYLSAQYIYVFRTVLTANKEYFLAYHELFSLWNRNWFHTSINISIRLFALSTGKIPLEWGKVARVMVKSP